MSAGTPIRTLNFATGVVTPVRSNVATDWFSKDIKTYETDNGTHMLEGVRVFKVGTFKDSFGIEHSWDAVHLEMMVANFNILRDSGAFLDVPWRADHDTSVKSVVGYIRNAYIDEEDSNFLAVDVELTEQEAWEKWERKTWRSRSLEIGMYETNDNKMFWPVIIGCAFVDIPAVEGLHNKSPETRTNFSQVVTEKEEGFVPPDINKDPEGWIKAVNYAAWIQSSNYAQALEDWTAAAVYAQGLEDEKNAQDDNGTPSITGTGNGTGNSGNSNHQSSQTPTLMTFRVNGQATSDFSAIQQHIDTLEAFRNETSQSNRREFVESLAAENKIAATQIEGLTNHALSLSDDQFASFRSTYDAAPAMPNFSTHGQQNGQQVPPSGWNPDGQQSNSSNGELEDVELAEEIVATHRRSGMSEDKVKKTASYQRLVDAGRV